MLVGLVACNSEITWNLEHASELVSTINSLLALKRYEIVDRARS